MEEKFEENKEVIRSCKIKEGQTIQWPKGTNNDLRFSRVNSSFSTSGCNICV